MEPAQMKILETAKKRFKLLLAIGIVSFIYSIAAHYINIPYWIEANGAEKVVLLLALAAYLWYRMRLNWFNEKKATGETIGFAFTLFFAVCLPVFCIIMSYTDAAKDTRSYLTHDRKLIEEIGNVKGFSMIQSGEMSLADDVSRAAFALSVQGEKKTKIVTVQMVKYKDSTHWQPLEE